MSPWKHHSLVVWCQGHCQKLMHDPKCVTIMKHYLQLYGTYMPQLSGIPRLIGRLMRRLCGFLVSSLFSGNTLLEAEVNALQIWHHVCVCVCVFKGYNYKDASVLFHLYLFHAPILVNDWMALDNLFLLSRSLRKDFCGRKACSQCNKFSCCWHRILRDFGQGKVWLVFFSCKNNKHYTIFLYLDA